MGAKSSPPKRSGARGRYHCARARGREQRDYGRDAGQEPLANVSLELIRSSRRQLEPSLTTIIGNHMTWGRKGIANDF